MELQAAAQGQSTSAASLGELPVYPDYEQYYRDASELAAWRDWGAKYKVDNVLRLLDVTPVMRIAELGCGEGAICRALASRTRAAEIVGLDVSTSAVELARATTPHDGIRYETYDGHRSHYDRDAFDLVLSSHVLEHVDNPRSYLAEIHRLAPLAVLEIPLEDNVRLGDAQRNTSIGHINYYRLGTIRALLRSSGFELSAPALITWPPLHKYSPGPRQLLVDWAKFLLLRLAPPVARGLLTYHATLLLNRQSN